MGDGQSVSGASDFGQPRAWGRYRLASPVCIDTLGEAWVGHVASGRDMGRTVLVTLMDFSMDSLVVRPIVQAARTALGIRHPNLLAFLDIVPSDEGIGLVSEYLDGEPLSTFLSSASAQGMPIAPGVAFSIVRSATQSLARLRAAHPREFSRGALCPETIFLTSFGETMLRQPSLMSAANQVAGFRNHPSSLPYRSPESLADPRENEESSDVFSMGVILWELLTGRSLFANHLRLGRLKRLPEEQVQAIEQRVLGGEIPALGAVARSGGALHPDAIRLVEWCLNRDPALRPQTLSELGRALTTLPTSLQAESNEVARAVQRVAGSAIDLRDRRLLGAKPPQVMPSPSASTATSVALGAFPPTEHTTARGPRPGATEPLEEPHAARSAVERLDESALDEFADEVHPPAVIAIDEVVSRENSRGGWLFAALALLGVGVASSLAVYATQTERATHGSGESEQRALVDTSASEQDASDAQSKPLGSDQAPAESQAIGSEREASESPSDPSPGPQGGPDTAPKTERAPEPPAASKPSSSPKKPVSSQPFRPKGI